MPASIRVADQPPLLLKLAHQASPFCSKDGQACASFPASTDHRTVAPLRSALFRDWLTAIFYKETDTAPSPLAFRTVLRTLEAQARFGDFPKQPVSRRIAFEGDPFFPSKIILDLANPAGEVVEITSRDYQITNNFKTAFHQSSSALPLPSPQSPAPSPQTSAPSPQPPDVSPQPPAPSPPAQSSQPPNQRLALGASVAHRRPPPHRPLPNPGPQRTLRKRQVRPRSRTPRSHRSLRCSHPPPPRARSPPLRTGPS
jgi:hypothetical protein